MPPAQPAPPSRKQTQKTPEKPKITPLAPSRRGTKIDYSTPQTLLFFIAHAMTAKSEREMLQILGDGWSTWQAHPLFVQAYDIATGRAAEVAGKELKDYIFGRLPTDLQKLWKDIDFWDDDDEPGAAKLEQLLNGKTDVMLQHLYLHALVCNSFNPSEACRKLAIPMTKLKKWTDTDADFSDLIDEITEHKKNFFEGALIDLVKARNPHAVIFVNKTMNAKRGYAEKLELNHTGEVTVNHNLVKIDDLDLDLETRIKIRDAMRKKQEDDKLRQAKPIEIAHAST